MTNLEYIRGLPEKELAELLVHSEEVNTGDENYDGEWVDYYETFYHSPNGCSYYGWEDAVEETIEWLRQKHDD